MILIPNSNGEPLVEMNDCHGPADGKFCAGSKTGLSRSDLEDRLTDEHGAALDIPAVLKANGVRVHDEFTPTYGEGKIWIVTLDKDRYGNSLYVVDDSGFIKEANEWVRDEDPSNWFEEADFNKDFWEGPGTLYHATTDENAARIDVEGINTMNKTRGLTNRGIGAAVFTSSNPESLTSYGDNVFEINMPAMKKDGYTPRVETETMVSDNELRASLAHKIGIRDWSEYSDDPGGEDPETVVIYGAIPPKYLTRMN